MRRSAIPPGGACEGVRLGPDDNEANPAARAAHEAVRAAARAQQLPQPPDSEHEWLTSALAAELMGVGPEAVRVRARRGKLPGELHDGRRWFRRDHLGLVKRADAVKRQDVNSIQNPKA